MGRLTWIIQWVQFIHMDSQKQRIFQYADKERREADKGSKRCYDAGFDDTRRSQEQRDTGKAQEMDSLLEPQKEMQPCPHSDFS